MCIRMVLCCAIVRPSFTFMWTVALQYSHWRWVSWSRCCMRTRSQKSAPFWSPRVWISWARISTHRAHIRPSTKLCHPRWLWSRAAIRSEEFGWRKEMADLVTRASRYDLITTTRSRPVFWSSIHCRILPMESRNTGVWPRSRQCVMCPGDLLLQPQLGQMFLTVPVQSMQESWWFVLLKCDTYLVIHTQNISGKDSWLNPYPPSRSDWSLLSALYSIGQIVFLLLWPPSVE